MSGLIYEQPESRSISGAGNSLRGQRVVTVKKGTFISEPELGAEWPEDRFKIYYNELSMSNNEAYTTYTFHYSKIKNKYTRSTIKTGLENIPYSEHKNYRTAWEYVLLTVDPNKKTTLPDWYETNTDGTSPDDEYQWALNASAAKPGTTWVVEGGTELQKGGRTFAQSTVIVSETYYHTTIEIPDKRAALPGMLRAPVYNHELKTDNKHWLVIAAPTSREGAFHLSNTMYKYKEYVDKDGVTHGWDEDIYETYS